MANMQHTKTVNASARKAAISGGSTKSGLVADMVRSALHNSSNTGMTATTPNALPKTWTSAELLELRRAAGLVAGALSDFQTAGGIVAVRNIEYEPGKFAVKIYLVAEGLNTKASQTVDGIDLTLNTYHYREEDDLVAVNEKVTGA